MVEEGLAAGPLSVEVTGTRCEAIKHSRVAFGAPPARFSGLDGSGVASAGAVPLRWVCATVAAADCFLPSAPEHKHLQQRIATGSVIWPK